MKKILVSIFCILALSFTACSSVKKSGCSSCKASAEQKSEKGCGCKSCENKSADKQTCCGK